MMSLFNDFLKDNITFYRTTRLIFLLFKSCMLLQENIIKKYFHGRYHAIPIKIF
jgi:hypothetical protein